MVTWREVKGNSQVFDQLVKLLASGEAVGFIGAGASAGLCPLWPQLIEQLADTAVEAELADEASKRTWCESMDALQAAKQIRRRLGEGTFAEQIREIFAPRLGADGKRYTPVHASLARLGFRAFVTTNYDPSLTIACQEYCRNVLVCGFDWRHDRVALWLDGVPATAGELPILYAHGQHDAKAGQVLDAEDYRRAYGDDRYRALFEHLWTRETLVIVGFSFTDSWLRIVADQALSQARTREFRGRRHIAVMGLAVEEIPVAGLHREAIEEPYHLRAIFYPVTRSTAADGTEIEDHSALGGLLEELVAASGPPPQAPAPVPSDPSYPLNDWFPQAAPAPSDPPDPLDDWFRQVADEHRRLGDDFERPAELRLLEQAWVQVHVQPAFDSESKVLEDAKHTVLGRPTTLDKVLELPAGEPASHRRVADGGARPAVEAPPCPHPVLPRPPRRPRLPHPARWRDLPRAAFAAASPPRAAVSRRQPRRRARALDRLQRRHHSLLRNPRDR